jgi:hypothetical protein
MTRIETIFGGVLAVAVLSGVAFIFFGQAPLEAAETRSDTPRRSAFVSSSVSDLLDEDSDDYDVPTTACGCYSLGFDMIRAKIDVGDPVYEAQTNACYEAVGVMGAEALADGAYAAVERERKSCRPGDYNVR